VTAAEARRYAILRRACAIVGVPYFRPRCEGLHHLPDGAFVVAASHTTLLDWAALAYFIPRPVRFLMTRAYYDRPLLRWFCRFGSALPVTPGRIEPSTFRIAVEALATGDVVGIFPEGRLRSASEPARAARGVIELAQRSGAPIVPATIRGAARAFPATSRLPRPFRVTVAFGAPLTVADDLSRPAQHAIASTLMTAIDALANGADARGSTHA